MLARHTVQCTLATSDQGHRPCCPPETEEQKPSSCLSRDHHQSALVRSSYILTHYVDVWMACYWQNVWSVTSLQTSNFLSVARHADICITREDAWWPDKSSDFKRSVSSMPCRHWHNVWRCMVTWQVLTGDDYGLGDWMVSVLQFRVDSMPTTWSELACVHCTVLQASGLILGLSSSRSMHVRPSTPYALMVRYPWPLYL